VLSAEVLPAIPGKMEADFDGTWSTLT